MRPRTLDLTPAQRAELERARNRDPRPYLREIAAALLKVADGTPARQVARHGLPRRRKPETLYRWLDKYQAGGLGALVHRPRGHRGSPPPVGEALVRAVRQEPALRGVGRSRWRRADLRAAVAGLAGYSLPGITKALRRLKVRLKRGRLRLHSPDPAYAAKMRLLERARALARDRPERVTVLFGDEFSFYRQPTLAATYAPVGEEPTADLSHRSNTRHRVCGALDAATGRLVRTAAAKAGVAHLRKFLRALRAAYPGREVLLVWDNWPVHQHPDVLAVAAELAIGILWLPTYAPWENPIEKLWRWCKQEVLHHHRLADRWGELKERVAAFLDRFNHGSADLLRYVGLLSD